MGKRGPVAKAKEYVLEVDNEEINTEVPRNVEQHYYNFNQLLYSPINELQTQFNERKGESLDIIQVTDELVNNIKALWVNAYNHTTNHLAKQHKVRVEDLNPKFKFVSGRGFCLVLEVQEPDKSWEIRKSKLIKYRVTAAKNREANIQKARSRDIEALKKLALRHNIKISLDEIEDKEAQ